MTSDPVMRGQDVELDGVSMRFGDFTAVHPTDLLIRAGEFFSILGPSGCGKTTILRMISGFLTPSAGVIRIGGEDMAGVGPNRRPTALIFQNLALFPLMSVWENVAFGLECRGVAKAERRRRADELLALVALTGQGHKKPTELSGGQRQRVAVARALAVEPAVLLLDEPLSALDLKLRQHMRTELRAIQKRVGITFVYITHDQGEALTMSDRIAVMSDGRIEQVDTPDRLYDAPASAFVATFVGENNVLRGWVRDAANGELVAETALGPVRASNPRGVAAGSEAMVFVRPERVRLGDGHGLDNHLAGRVVRRELEGPFAQLAVATPPGLEVLVHQTNHGEALDCGVGDEVSFGFRATDALALPAGELARE
jgi:spermidine/putrescine transport system ATP-binding protein